MEINEEDFTALLGFVCSQARTEGYARARTDEELGKLRSELNEARELIRIHKHTAETSENKAKALEMQLGKERATVEKLENTLANFARHNKTLRDKLEAAGIDAPTYAEFLIMQSAEKDAEEMARELRDEEEGEE